MDNIEVENTMGAQNESEVFEMENSEKGGDASVSSLKMLRFGSVLQTWVEISKINYVSSLVFDDLSKDPRLRSKTFSVKSLSAVTIGSEPRDPRPYDDYPLPVRQKFPINLTSLLNETNLWGCFYPFPELYNDIYSPVVKIKDEILPIVDGVLGRDTVAACLSYLKRSPISGDYVYIKLDISLKLLINIDVLQYYKYLVYLDLSSNLLTELKVLSHLLYLQYLSVDFNRLSTVLDYDTPQWFLTEVHYKYNTVVEIRDLNMFWSLTSLDLSHNDIVTIQGLQRLSFLRRLDLSFNNIDRLEGLNNLRLQWLDLSYNNIGSFECNSYLGLKTLLHLEYLNLNENKLTSLKIFTGCTRLRELHARNNHFSMLLEVSLYMQRLRRLIILDLRSNPICHVNGYNDVIIKTFPILLHLDAETLDPKEVAAAKMDITPDVSTFASRRLLRLMYIHQLTRAKVSPYVPPADTTDVPLIVLVGYEAVGKGSLARRIAAECPTNVELAVQHSTATCHSAGHYRVVTRRNFDGMLLAGEFLTYTEMDGESYGLSVEEAFVSNGRVKVTSMDLIGALMLKMRGLRPYLILTSCTDKAALMVRQEERKRGRYLENSKNFSTEAFGEMSTLQLLLSGRIIINGILNEILQGGTNLDEFNKELTLDSECSLMQSSENISGDDDEAIKSESQMNASLYSLYKEPRSMNEFVSDVYRHISQDKNLPKKNIEAKHYIERGREIIKYRGWHGAQSCGSRNTSKSVAFTSPERPASDDLDTLEVLKDPQGQNENINLKTINTDTSYEQELWRAFLEENDLLESSDINCNSSEAFLKETNTNKSNYKSGIKYFYEKIPSDAFTTNIRDDYEDIHRKCPGMFWDTITMDNPKIACKKLKGIIKNIVDSQSKLKPLYDIDWANNFNQYPTVTKKLQSLCDQIAPQQLFY